MAGMDDIEFPTLGEAMTEHAAGAVSAGLSGTWPQELEPRIDVELVRPAKQPCQTCQAAHHNQLRFWEQRNQAATDAAAAWGIVTDLLAHHGIPYPHTPARTDRRQEDLAA
jgi:hypothetical protein